MTRSHVLVDGVWQRSPEVKKRAKLDGYRRAGVPDVYSETPMADLKKGSLIARKRLTLPIANDRSLLMWVHASELKDSRAQTTAFLIRKYLDAGLTAQTYRLPKLVDTKFDNAEWKDTWSNLTTVSLLILEVSNEGNHRMAPDILKETVVARNRNHGLTVVMSGDDIAVMVPRYGETMAKMFAKIKKTRRYISG